MKYFLLKFPSGFMLKKTQPSFRVVPKGAHYLLIMSIIITCSFTANFGFLHELHINQTSSSQHYSGNSWEFLCPPPQGCWMCLKPSPSPSGRGRPSSRQDLHGFTTQPAAAAGLLYSQISSSSALMFSHPCNN